MKSLNSFIENYSILDRLLTFENKVKQDGPSLESSSYLNVTLRYLGPWDLGTHGPMELGTPGPWTFGLLDLFPPPPPPHTSSYLLLSLPPTGSFLLKG